MSPRRLQARIVSKTPLHAGFLRLNRYRLQVDRRDGGTREYDWELMERADSVGVLGYDPRLDAVLLGNECRPGALVSGDYPFRDQLIAGALDGGESPLDAAVREMQEEAGLALRDPQLIHRGAYVSSGGTTERVALVFGYVDLQGVAGAVHGVGADEEVMAVVMPATQFIERALTGEADDCKTLLAGYWFAQRHASLRGG